MIRRAVLLTIASLPTALFAQTPGVAGIQQDVASLQDQVRRLHAEVEELRTNQEALKKALAAGASAGAATGSADARIAALEASLKADHEESGRRIAALRAEVNRALATQTKQVNDALRPANPPATPPVATTKEPAATDPAPPADMPKVGVTYKVQPGDSVSRIAKKFNSRADWILAANKLGSNSDLKAFAVIFVPRAEPDADPAE